MQLFEAETANEAWKNAASHLLADQNGSLQMSRGGNTRELLHTVFSIKNPSQRWVASRTPALNPAFALVEVVWILSGRDDAKFLNFFSPSLPKFAGTAAHYHGAYGFRLKHQFKLDQLERAYYTLLNNPDSRQVVLQIWDPRVDFPNEDGSATAPDIPCNISSMLKVREGKLDWVQVLRSNDIYRGVPYNFVQFTALQEIVAGWLEIESGEYVHFSDSLHIYTRDLRKNVLDHTVIPEMNTDTLGLPKKVFDVVISDLGRCIDEIISESNKDNLVSEMIEHGELPVAYQNMLRLIGAEVARRLGRSEFAGSLMCKCSNPALKQTWQRWLARNHELNTISIESSNTGHSQRPN